MSNTIILENLVGSHLLSGVDRLPDHPMMSEYDTEYSGEVLRFTLDGVTYMVREDDNDGYRSAMRDVLISDTPPVNTFPPVPVVASYVTKAATVVPGWNDYETNDVLVLARQDNGVHVLAVGTRDVDDYYPTFVAHFDPEALGLVQEHAG